MADNFDDYYSDSDEVVEREIKIPDIGDEYRGLVAPITKDDVKYRRQLLKDRRSRRAANVTDAEMDQIVRAYRSIYGRDPQSLLLRQPHTDDEYDQYGNRIRKSSIALAADRKGLGLGAQNLKGLDHW